MSTFIHKVEIFFLVILYLWEKLHWWEIVGITSLFLLIFAMLLNFFIFPIMFHCYLIPRVERNIGRKFEFSPYVRSGFFPGSYLTKKTEMANYIVNRYQILKKRRSINLSKEDAEWAAKSITPGLNEITKFELIVSYWVKYSLKIGMLALVVLLIVVNLHPS